MLLFMAAGIGNGSTFRMIPAIFLQEHRRKAAAEGRADDVQVVRDANTESAAALGFSSAIGAFGGFFIPMSYGASISMTGTAESALHMFIIFYLTCIAITWWSYLRPGAKLQV